MFSRLVVSAVAVVVLAGCASGVSAQRVAPSPTPSAADYSGLPAEFGGNTSVVAGVDIQPGVYEEETPSPNCEWYKGVDGKLTNSSDTETVIAGVGETVEVHGCSAWVKFAEVP